MDDPQGILEEFALCADLAAAADAELVIRGRTVGKRLGFNNQSGMNGRRLCKQMGREKRKLDDDTVRAIRKADGPTRKIAERFGVSRGSVLKIRRGETYRDVV